MTAGGADCCFKCVGSTTWWSKHKLVLERSLSANIPFHFHQCSLISSQPLKNKLYLLTRILFLASTSLAVKVSFNLFAHGKQPPFSFQHFIFLSKGVLFVLHLFFCICVFRKRSSSSICTWPVFHAIFRCCFIDKACTLPLLPISSSYNCLFSGVALSIRCPCMFCRTISSFLFSLPFLQGVFFYCFIHQVCTLLLLEKFLFKLFLKCCHEPSISLLKSSFRHKARLEFCSSDHAPWGALSLHLCIHVWFGGCCHCLWNLRLDHCFGLGSLRSWLVLGQTEMIALASLQGHLGIYSAWRFGISWS